MSATLGGLLKDYRLQKGISQLEISFAMGWKEPSRLSRIEQGKTTKPSRELIDRLASIMNLSDYEKNNLLYIGSYLPNEDEIKAITSETKSFLDGWKYPAILFDFSWRNIYINAITSSVYQVEGALQKKITKEYPRIFEIIFDKSLTDKQILNEETKVEWYRMLAAVMTQFKYEQQGRTKEEWYTKHISAMMSNEEFRRLWVETGESKQHPPVIGKFAQKILLNPNDKKSILRFYLFIVPVTKDPRFSIELLFPQDKETFDFFG